MAEWRSETADEIRARRASARAGGDTQTIHRVPPRGGSGVSGNPTLNGVPTPYTYGVAPPAPPVAYDNHARGMFAAALADPADRVSCLALADWHAERGFDELALAWRWLARAGKRPGRLAVVPGWFWFREGMEDGLRETAWAREVPTRPFAGLPAPLFVAAVTATGSRPPGGHELYAWVSANAPEDAVALLSRGLSALRGVCEGEGA